jgi:hypothetical protein
MKCAGNEPKVIPLDSARQTDHKRGATCKNGSKHHRDLPFFKDHTEMATALTVTLGAIHVNFATLVLSGYMSAGGVPHMDCTVRSA